MIKEKEVLVKVNPRNINYYQKLGFKISTDGIVKSKEIVVPVDIINHTSKIKITAICNFCKSENKIMISKYYTNFNRNNKGYYSCFKCKNIEKEKTCLEKYGEKSFSLTEEFSKKFKETSMVRYGVDNPNKNIDIRNKTKKTCLEKYGFTTHLLQPEIVDKNRIWMSSDKFKEKSKISLLEKYGVDSFSKTEEFKKILESKKDIIIEKIKQTFLERYGVDSSFKTDKFKKRYRENILSIKQKKIDTCMEKYGVENVSQVKEIYDKILNTKINNDYIIPDHLLTKWEIYKKETRKLTNKIKKSIYENWDGYDYYDNEYIKGYQSYSHVHRFYPTIDHKISVYYGFMNNIEPKEICDTSNLCITKRYINSIKNKIIESEFIYTSNEISKEI